MSYGVRAPSSNKNIVEKSIFNVSSLNLILKSRTIYSHVRASWHIRDVPLFPVFPNFGKCTENVHF